MDSAEETPLIEVLKLGLEKYPDKLVQEISSQGSNDVILGKAPIQLMCKGIIIFSGWPQYGTNRRDSCDGNV